MNKKTSTLFMLIGLFLCLGFSPAALAQKESLGAVKYAPPTGWTKAEQTNLVIFSNVNQAARKFGLIKLYGATASTGNPQADFDAAWKELLVKPLGADANPQTEKSNRDGWTLIAGGAKIEFQGESAIAYLGVVSGFGKTVSLLGVFNDDKYVTEIAEFLGSIEIDKPTTRVERVDPPAQPAFDAAPMHAAALVKEFENNEIHALETYRGKRMRVYGTVNSIEIDRAGRIVLTFKTSVTTYKMARCYFPRSQSSRVGALKAHEEATVEGTVRGLGDGFDNTKSFLVLEDCVVP